MKDPKPKIKKDFFSPFVYSIKNKVSLNRDFKVESKDFLETIFSRKSSREFSNFSLCDLEKLLFYSCKIKSIEFDENNFLLTNRVTPSAGGRHPIDVLVSLPQKERILSYYNPIDHTLGELKIEKKKLDVFFSDINKNLAIKDACIIWFSIQVNKTSSKYDNAESLYWKDSGVLLFAIQLFATFLGYKSCPLGTLASNSFNKLFNDKNLFSGGGILIGL